MAPDVGRIVTFGDPEQVRVLPYGAVVRVAQCRWRGQIDERGIIEAQPHEVRQVLCLLHGQQHLRIGPVDEILTRSKFEYVGGGLVAPQSDDELAKRPQKVADSWRNT